MPKLRSTGGGVAGEVQGERRETKILHEVKETGAYWCPINNRKLVIVAHGNN